MSSKKGPKEGMDFKSLIRKAGLRVTIPRIAVLELLEKLGAPMSHVEVHHALGTNKYDKATLYRNLVDMAELGLLTRSDHGDHVWRFEIRNPDAASSTRDSEAHPHFVCTDCGTVQCLDSVEVSIKRTRGVAAPAAVAKRAVQVKLQGVCDDCA
jgi:Fur family ferric uptake transcriptional regulator